MTSDTRFGVLLGALVASASIAGNVWRGDDHLMSMYPGVVTALLVPAVMYISARRRARMGAGASSLLRFGLHVGFVAGAVFGAGMAWLTVVWLSSSGAILPLFAAVSAFSLTATGSWAAAAGVARSHPRAS